MWQILNVVEQVLNIILLHVFILTMYHFGGKKAKQEGLKKLELCLELLGLRNQKVQPLWEN